MIDIARLAGKTRWVNITLPERVLSLIDTYAVGRGKSRSGLIAEAMIEYIAARSQRD